MKSTVRTPFTIWALLIVATLCSVILVETSGGLGFRRSATVGIICIAFIKVRWVGLDFMELRNAQAVTLAYDGSNPKPPMFCYLKPYYNDPNKSYFLQVAEGEL